MTRELRLMISSVPNGEGSYLGETNGISPIFMFLLFHLSNSLLPLLPLNPGYHQQLLETKGMKIMG